LHVVVAYEGYREAHRIRLGALEERVPVKFGDDFTMTPGELIGE
jgi:hypothetical protein